MLGRSLLVVGHSRSFFACYGLFQGVIGEDILYSYALNVWYSKNQMFKEINKLNPRKAFPALVFY